MRLKDPGEAKAFPVASNTTRSSGNKPRASTRNRWGCRDSPAERARPPSAIAISQKLRCTSNPTDLPTITSPSTNEKRGDGGQERHVRTALAADPDLSQGQPVTPAGSQPITRLSPPTGFSESPCPERPRRYRLRRKPGPAPRRILMPVHHLYRHDRVPKRSAIVESVRASSKRAMSCGVDGRRITASPLTRRPRAGCCAFGIAPGVIITAWQRTCAHADHRVVPRPKRSRSPGPFGATAASGAVEGRATSGMADGTNCAERGRQRARAARIQLGACEARWRYRRSHGLWLLRAR
jgi:hypothetical protein